MNEMALANALGLLGAVYYLVCYLVASLAPELYKVVASSWMHMLDLSTAWKSAPSGLVLGLISFTIVAWVSGWLLAFTYNKLLKR